MPSLPLEMFGFEVDSESLALYCDKHLLQDYEGYTDYWFICYQIQ